MERYWDRIDWIEGFDGSGVIARCGLTVRSQLWHVCIR